MFTGKNNEQLVISWDDNQAIQLEYRPIAAMPPVVAGLAVKPERLTAKARRIYVQPLWYEHMHRRRTHLAAQALRHHKARELVTNLTLGWDMALAEAADGLKIPYTVLLPSKGMKEPWGDYQKQLFSRLLGRAHEQRVLNLGDYDGWKRKLAQAEKLRRCDLLLTLWDGKDNEVKRALKKAETATMVSLWDSWKRYGGLFA